MAVYNDEIQAFLTGKFRTLREIVRNMDDLAARAPMYTPEHIDECRGKISAFLSDEYADDPALPDIDNWEGQNRPPEPVAPSKYVDFENFPETLSVGSPVTLGVSLSEQPTGDVTISVTSPQDLTDIRVLGSPLTIAPANWDFVSRSIALVALRSGATAEVAVSASGGGFDDVSDTYTVTIP